MSGHKPLSLRDLLVRKLSVSLRMNEEIIDTVIQHQFKLTNEAFQKYDCLELSGFGKFYYNHKKAKKQLGIYLKRIDILNEQIAKMEEGPKKQKLIYKRNVFDSLKTVLEKRVCL